MGVLAACLMAWTRGDDDTDAQAGAFRFAEWMLRLEQVAIGLTANRTSKRRR